MSSVFFMVLNISLKMGKKWLITTKVYFVVLLSGKNKLKALYLFVHRYCSCFTHPGAWFSVSNCKHFILTRKDL